MEQLFPTLTETRCDCCGVTVVDGVALIAVCDAVRAHRDELDAKAERDRQAWDQAFTASQAAHEAAKHRKAQ